MSDSIEKLIETTPVMKQHGEIKKAYPDAILFFRLGDFYEMFGDDAIIASKVLQIALTARNKTKKDPVPMCGVPYFAADAYLKKLVNAGYKVAVCEQTEDAALAKGIVRREVTRVATPGTYEPDNPKENTFIMSFLPTASVCGIAIADISTGQFIVYETSESISDEIHRFGVREILCPQSLKQDIHYSAILKNYFTSYYDDYCFDHSEAYRTALNFFKVSTLEGFGCEDKPAAVRAAGGLLSYLIETQKTGLEFSKIRTLNNHAFMFLDMAAIRNLELVNSLKDSSTEGTLISVLDETLTPMGARFMRENIIKPLIDKNDIRQRLDAVEYLFTDFKLRDELRTRLRIVQDVERLTSRLTKGTATARDLIAIKTSVETMPELKAILKAADNLYLCAVSDLITDFTSLIQLINDSIVDTPPNTVKDGWIIRDGFNKEIDELRRLSTNGKTYLTELEGKERTATGINSLKIAYNKVFGYYIEVTKMNLHLVPAHYIRKQTLTNAERYVTPEIKDYEDKILGAEEKLKNLEYKCFKDLLDKALYYANELRETAQAVAALDYIQALAVTARKNRYVKPVVTAAGEIRIVEGRHPVIERSSTVERFIPNDTYLDLDEEKLHIITGPNMAGKSTFMRQTALIVLMAQMGSFVPAEAAEIGIVDRIFTRIGASDYLSMGQSTFMVEMIETSNIINNATQRSLIILDEVGRGTSTFDGISIAWAVAEYIANEVGARTLFATHYNELTELALTTRGVKNYNVSVKEWGDEIIFVRKIVRGSADKSYGIQVARLAGLPDGIIGRSKDILAELEKKDTPDEGRSDDNRFTIRKKRKPAAQLDLFSSLIVHPVVQRLSKIDINNTTPEAAVELLKELKKLSD
ncbi:DNA mismatch repair protein MutS [Candidatus Magnetominusculus xianensis]|uniref:DNA mismatch repair protein MutS n=1 Tax=Candidatus Magnetominusculus xianensis TaxID=1748249 RepID=A0ABR5SD26_9BACT|nr:DNA mismatch repair protein MutS [Candidatus Magnetominusculus xianensis]KWT82637.1 DNA mismatch repair protein MutS [Candidatus Magnetominusculus xianensis]MBF0405286.1 DNA mismatch repair protein MutS [Nitrospirota bacterium]